MIGDVVSDRDTRDGDMQCTVVVVVVVVVQLSCKEGAGAVNRAVLAEAVAAA